MILPQRVQDIARALYERHLDLARGDEEHRRQLARYIAEQTRFELGPTWGHKKADEGRPPSKDAIAQKQRDGKLFGWDLFNGTSREPNVDPDSIDITGQVFIDVSPGMDYLGEGPPHEPPPPPPPDDDYVLAALKHLGEQYTALAGQMSHVANLLQRPAPDYAGAGTVNGPISLSAFLGGTRNVNLPVTLTLTPTGERHRTDGLQTTAQISDGARELPRMREHLAAMEEAMVLLLREVRKVWAPSAAPLLDDDEAAKHIATTLADFIAWLSTVPAEQEQGLSALIAQDVLKWRRLVQHKETS